MNNVAVLVFAAGLAFAQIPDPGYGSAPPLNREFARGLVYRTRSDLGHAADSERHNGHRKESALGHYDSGKLDIPINDVRIIVEHHTLDTNAHDALSNDLMDLKDMRLHHP